ncbi:hypothetical protein H072_9097 [Dactylellina haptotyla CBS 200.50]|uniref:F-box domain-containing protein n=1 Tax=Dactylellina haptotyla (strain CBS 200.50) TaxID=1284197 RepID=S8BQ01_DACHA|nr:hypothetical protein H072_9097 [Dactylellina haptotyla CBS 200.50]
MSFAIIPPEILQQVGDFLYEPELATLSQCSRRLNEIFIPILYRNLELRVYGKHLTYKGKIFPKSLVVSESAESFKEVRNLAILGCDHPYANDKDDDGECVLLDVRKVSMVIPLMEFIKRIPVGRLLSFEYKVAFPINRQLWVQTLNLQPNIVYLHLSCRSSTHAVSPNELLKISLPSLHHFSVVNICDRNDVQIIEKILDAAYNIHIIDLVWDPNFPGTAKEDLLRLTPGIVRNNPKALRLANTSLGDEIFATFEGLEELHLKNSVIEEGASTGDKLLTLKRLLIISVPTFVRFYQDEIIAKIRPGLEEFHLTIEHVDRDGGTEVRDTIPIPVEYILRHRETLQYLSLFEKTSQGNMFIDPGPVCSDELQLFKELKMKEFATAVNFYCQQRTPAYWRTFDMSPVDVNYGHYASLDKLYIVPDMISLNTQIENDQVEFWELNPRNILTYQMASIVLTNIGLYATEIPKLRYIIVGMGSAYTGQKAFEVTWLKHVPPRKKGQKVVEAKYLFTISPPYELNELRSDGIEFQCFEGTRFSTEEDRRVRSFW